MAHGIDQAVDDLPILAQSLLEQFGVVNAHDNRRLDHRHRLLGGRQRLDEVLARQLAVDHQGRLPVGHRRKEHFAVGLVQPLDQRQHGQEELLHLAALGFR